jgi:hypothetical protein
MWAFGQKAGLSQWRASGCIQAGFVRSVQSVPTQPTCGGAMRRSWLLIRLPGFWRVARFHFCTLQLETQKRSGCTNSWVLIVAPTFRFKTSGLWELTGPQLQQADYAPTWTRILFELSMEMAPAQRPPTRAERESSGATRALNSN